MKFRIKLLIAIFIFAESFSQNLAQENNSQNTFVNSIEFIGQWKTDGQAKAVFISGNNAYLGNGNNVDLLDISNLTSPKLINQIKLSTSFPCNDIVGNPNLIFIANNQSIYEYNIADPANPDSVAELDLNSVITDIYYRDNKIYAITSYDFYIIDVNEDNSIHITGSLSLPGSSLGLTRFDLENDIAFVASWSGGIYVLDISNSNEPLLQGRFLDNVNLVYAKGDIAFASDNRTTYILDITDYVLPIINLSASIKGTPHDLYSDGIYIYYLINDKLDIYNNNLELINTYSLNDEGQRFLFSDGKIFVANNLEGLKILKFGNANSIKNNDNIINDFELGQNYPNPFNSQTKINYYISEYCNVEIDLYDALGKKVKNLLNENKTAGAYSIEFNSIDLSSGIYFYILRTSTGYTSSKKFILLK